MLVAAIALAIQSTWTRTLPNGVTLNLLGVVDIPTKKAWDPAGKPISFKAPPFLIADSGVKKTDKALAAVVDIFGVSKSLAPTLAFSEGTRKSTGGGMGSPTNATDPYQATANFSFPKNKATCDLTIACATDNWKTIGTVDQRTGKASGISFAPKVAIQKDYVPADKTQYEIQITIPKSLRDGKTNYKLVAYGTDTKQMEDVGTMSRQTDKGPFQFEFRSDHKKLGRIELQARPYQFVTFKSVRLQPRR
jgi:hypothetical protein